MSVNPHVIPQTTRDALLRFWQEGIMPGAFLTAVLSNDLLQAYLLSDRENLDALGAIVGYIHHELPSACWGNRDIVEAWGQMMREDYPYNRPVFHLLDSTD